MSTEKIAAHPFDTEALAACGIKIEEQDIPGLVRINGGPELTYRQALGEIGRLVTEHNCGR